MWEGGDKVHRVSNGRQMQLHDASAARLLATLRHSVAMADAAEVRVRHPVGRFWLKPGVRRSAGRRAALEAELARQARFVWMLEIGWYGDTCLGPWPRPPRASQW